MPGPGAQDWDLVFHLFYLANVSALDHSATTPPRAWYFAGLYNLNIWDDQSHVGLSEPQVLNRKGHAQVFISQQKVLPFCCDLDLVSD